jgi:hypothetical protein
MFALTSKAVSSPVTSPPFRKMKDDDKGKLTETFTQYLEDHRCNNSTTVSTMGGMIMYLMVDAEGKNASSDSSKSLFRPGAIAQLKQAITNAAGEDSENVEASKLNIPHAANWLVNLLNASHKKKLTAGNVEGFFAMMRHTGTSGSAIAWLINSISPFYPDSILATGFRELLADGVWTTYRMTRVTTGQTMWKNIDAFRDLGITVKGDAVEAVIKASFDAPWDVTLSMKIPEKYKAYTCVYLETAGIPIEKWYQGNSARDALPAARVRGAKEIFRRYLEVKNSVKDLEKIDTVSAFAKDEQVTGFW